MHTREHIRAYTVLAVTFLLVIMLCYVRNRNTKTSGQLPYYQKERVEQEHVEHETHINTGDIAPAKLVSFACSLAGTPYKYGSTDPKEGFDCSGYITYVFNHFHIAVPRSSVDFTQVQHEVKPQDAKAGDLVLFTGTDSTIHVVGHMGIITSSPNEPLRFMHATSGKNHDVMESDLYSAYYQSRFVKIIRVFPQNDH